MRLNIAELKSIGHEVVVATRYSALKGFRDYDILKKSISRLYTHLLNGSQIVYEMLRRSCDLIHCFYPVFPQVRGLAVKVKYALCVYPDRNCHGVRYLLFKTCRCSRRIKYMEVFGIKDPE